MNKTVQEKRKKKKKGVKQITIIAKRRIVTT